MKTTHYLKTDPAVFGATITGHKTHEIRLNDRGFKVGDTLVLRETTETGAAIAAGAPLAYTGCRAVRVVTHVLEGYGLAPGWCILSCALPDDEADADEAIRLAAIALAADSVGDFVRGAHWSRGSMLAERAGHSAAIGHLSALVDELRGQQGVLVELLRECLAPLGSAADTDFDVDSERLTRGLVARIEDAVRAIDAEKRARHG